MNYKDYLDNKQKEFGSLPIFFAFGREQFKKAMEEHGLTEKDTDKIYKLGDTGGFYLRENAPIIREYFNKPDELPTLMKDSKFAVDAFYYEMLNHEYHINLQGDYDVCSCFGKCEYAEDKGFEDYLKEMGYSDDVLCSFISAYIQYSDDVKKNNIN